MRLANWTLVAAAMAFALMIGQAARADDKGEKSHEGKVVKAGEGKLTMTDKDGGKQHTHLVPATAKVICDGKECRLEDLKPGTVVKVTMKGDGEKAVARIEARTDGKK